MDDSETFPGALSVQMPFQTSLSRLNPSSIDQNQFSSIGGIMISLDTEALYEPHWKML